MDIAPTMTVNIIGGTYIAVDCYRMISRVTKKTHKVDLVNTNEKAVIGIR